jgi:hypothetical protein
MARIRTIKPQFFMNEEIASMPHVSRLLFIGLWCLADREGRLDDRPVRIKAQILPYEDHDIDSTLNNLQEKGFIIRYSVKSEKFIQINNFSKHQHCNIKESESTIPTPYKHHANTVLKRREGKGKEQEGKGKDMREHPLPVWIDRAAWGGFVEMRESIKAPLKTERAANLIIAKLQRLKETGQDPNAILDQSTMNSWKGVFELKEFKNGEQGADMAKRTAQQELLAQLKDRNGKAPYLSKEAQELFYSLKQHWEILRKRVQNGENIFSEPPPDLKALAANDK